MKKLILTALACVFVFSVAIIISPRLTGSTPYVVYCAEGKIEVDTRTLDEMKSARGSNCCVKGTFDYSSDAEKFAESLGGKGAACACN
jgi:hypothetical protein